jgi:magnesium-transporting ATPase (P-type)
MLSGFGTLVPDECIVIRDGCPVQVLSKDLVIGDLVVLQTGAKVPSDIRAVTSHNLRVDKSLLTGEAEPCKVILLYSVHIYIYIIVSYECFCCESLSQLSWCLSANECRQSLAIYVV